MPIVLTGNDLTIEDLVKVARNNEKVELPTDVVNRIKNCRVMLEEKIAAKEEVLNFNLSASEVNDRIRAFSPKPGAYFTYNNEIIKIICATAEDSNEKHQPGTVIDNNLSIACKGSILKPTLLQRQGRKMIYTDAFLRGFNIPIGTLLNS